MKFERNTVKKALESPKERFTRNSASVNPYKKRTNQTSTKRNTSKNHDDSDYSNSRDEKVNVVSPNSSKTNGKKNSHHENNDRVPINIHYNNNVAEKNDGVDPSTTNVKTNVHHKHKSTITSNKSNQNIDDKSTNSTGKDNIEITLKS